jgi:5-methyltetrahydropteroyltriglutamate--homocysteine methyltransferase
MRPGPAVAGQDARVNQNSAVNQDSFGAATVLGYPRIGPRRELKRALETYWDGRSGRAELLATGRQLRAATWLRLRALGLPAVPSNTFSLYDHVLDTAVLLDAVPDRYRGLSTKDGTGLDGYFAMARGTADLAPLPMTKWFDTNYHFIVPEIGAGTRFRLAGDKPLAEEREARALGLATRPVLLGPVTFLLLSRAEPGSPPGFQPLHRLGDLLEVYATLLAALAAQGVAWVQLDEPALSADRTPAELAAVREAYRYLGGLAQRPRLFVASYFGSLGGALPVLAGTPVEAIGVDLVPDRGATVDPVAELWPHLDALSGTTLVAGVVSGRGVWRTDSGAALALLRALRSRVGEVVVGTSCPLLHVPYDVEAETDLDPALRGRLAFAEQKVAEVVALATRLAALPDNPGFHPPRTPAVAETAEADVAGRAPYPVRAAAQAARLRLPSLPVTTIGSFPQTGDLRAARAARAAGRIDEEQYARRIRAEIERVIRLQERLGLDVLVHGEPERNDMVQYFAEHLDGFATTRYGWVQSYGSRCTRPPILHGDVRRRGPITVGWTRYAQSLTDRPVKGMLTGPVTIVAWSFVRDDVPLRRVVWQVAGAIRDEVRDLAAAGTAIIQVDEPALREMMPLRRAGQAGYLDWAVRAYRHATAGAGDGTAIHTHLCYSEAADILGAIDALDADVTSIESARSGARILDEPAVAQFARGLGPGVYDIHSPRVPTVAEVSGLLGAALRVLPPERLWVNPDCGLKTRTYEQVEPALRHVVAAARDVRAALVVDGAGVAGGALDTAGTAPDRGSAST